MEVPRHRVLRLLVAGSLLLLPGPLHGGAPRYHSRQECHDDGACLLLFRESLNFTGARDLCSEAGGTLAAGLKTSQKVPDLLRRSSGSLWVGLTRPDGVRCPDNDSATRGYEWITGGGGAPPAGDFPPWARAQDICDQRCASVWPNGSLQQQPCGATLDGFLCTATQECAARERLAAPGVHSVSNGSTDDARLPAGAVWSTRGEKDATHADAKWLCAFREWWSAPWSCEVFTGGCSHTCLAGRCACPEGHALHANNLTCVALAPRECSDAAGCPGPHSRCERQPGGGAKCACQEGFVADAEGDGACVNVSVCMRCEHDCVRAGMEYVCRCRAGFRAIGNLCVRDCHRPACPAHCLGAQCGCPDGYILDEPGDGAPLCLDRDECADSSPCAHACLNTQGGYACTCAPGHSPTGEGKCELALATDEPSSSSSSSSSRPDPDPDPAGPPSPTGGGGGGAAAAAAEAEEGAVPSYVRVGAALGMAVFVALALALLYLLLRAGLGRCRGALGVGSLREASLDTLTLQQVTTEKYQRFSFDKQNGTDGQRL